MYVNCFHALVARLQSFVTTIGLGMLAVVPQAYGQTDSLVC